MTISAIQSHLFFGVENILKCFKLSTTNKKGRRYFLKTCNREKETDFNGTNAKAHQFLRKIN